MLNEEYCNLLVFTNMSEDLFSLVIANLKSINFDKEITSKCTQNASRNVRSLIFFSFLK